MISAAHCPIVIKFDTLMWYGSRRSQNCECALLVKDGEPSTLWRSAILRGHGSGVTQRPSPATRTWWWWWWWWRTAPKWEIFKLQYLRADCSISLKFGTGFIHVTGKRFRSKVQTQRSGSLCDVTCRGDWNCETWISGTIKNAGWKLRHKLLWTAKPTSTATGRILRCVVLSWSA